MFCDQYIGQRGERKDRIHRRTPRKSGYLCPVSLMFVPTSFVAYWSVDAKQRS